MLRLFVIVLIVALLGVQGGFFIASNPQEIALFSTWHAQPIEISIGVLAVLAFMVGFGVGILVCVLYVILQSLELRKLRRQLRAGRPASVSGGQAEAR
jgi:uncharacterized membrane protein YciS (DUF1049 family)